MKNNSQMIVCYPVLPGNGSKFTATNLAYAYKDAHPEKKVALVDFDLKMPYLAGLLSTSDNVHGLDNLIEKIDGEFLDEQMFEENMIEMKNGVELLKGTKIKHTYNFIGKHHMEQIISLLRKKYDVIFTSVASEADNVGTNSVLFDADKIVMVTRNDFRNHVQFEDAVTIVNHYGKDDSSKSVLFNMYDEQSNLDYSQLLKYNELDVVGYVSFDMDNLDNRNLSSNKGGKFFGRKGTSTYDDVLTKLMGEE